MLETADTGFGPPSFPSRGHAAMKPVSFPGIESILEETRRKSQAADSTSFLADFQRASLASAFAEKLIRAIHHFDAELDQEHEAGMRLVSFGQTITFHVLDVRYHNPSLLFFKGIRETGQQVELIQHVSQLLSPA